jgi:Domain of unknown function (DUF1707)
MLASDREREATILRLRAAHLEGRIDTDELEERVGRAHAARTRDELHAVAVDVPDRPGAEVDPTRGVPRVPGRRRFAERKLIDGTVDEVRERLLTHVLPPLARQAFYVHRATADVITVENRARTGSRFSLRLHDAGDRRTLVVVQGAAPLSVRRVLAQL